MSRVMCDVYEDVTAAYAPAHPEDIEADEDTHRHVLAAVNLHEARQHDAALELGRIANTPPDDLLTSPAAPRPPPPKSKGADAAAALSLFGAKRKSSKGGSQDGSPPARRQSTGASAHLAAAAVGAMGTEAELEAMAVGEAAEGGGGSPRRRSGWGVGEAPMDAEVEAAQRADNFRLIDMLEIVEQAC